jgi:hypothetical protein
VVLSHVSVVRWGEEGRGERRRKRECFVVGPVCEKRRAEEDEVRREREDRSVIIIDVCLTFPRDRTVNKKFINLKRVLS